MPSKPLTLASFLLARIAEDDGKARRDIETSPEASLVRGYATRVLLGLEVNRRIVAAHSQDTQGTDVFDCYWTYGGTEDPCLTLRHLASVYADHPDFDKRWRAHAE